MRFQVSKPVLCGSEKKYVCDALDTGWISSNGSYIAKFEKAVSGVIGVDECIAASNGTAALHLACLSMEVKPGDEVIVPALTYVASANAVAYCGARPVFADCDIDTWNATPETIAAVITEKTVGVMVVHLYGVPCPVEDIMLLCREKGIWMIEDCAESLGATCLGKPTGSFGDAATFSFYGNKTISTGEGGMLFVKDPERRKLAKLYRGQGMDPERRYWHSVMGYNYRMTNVSAAIGLGQIEMFEYHLSERRRIAGTYSRCLHDLENAGALRLPVEPEGYANSYWLYSVVLQAGGAQRRDAIMDVLAEKYGIESRPFFVPMHWLPMYKSGLSLPNAEFLATHGINLPTYSGLADQDIEYISDCLRETIASVS